jgi:translation initiation factor eIF-2B subunit delta
LSGDPEDLAIAQSNGKCSELEGWRDIEQLNVLNLVYDVTPPNFITMVITEVGMIPCTSVPVVLRVTHGVA